ncbi:HNH endonuclease family protein [Gordonia amicalis]|uniref:HNH endonuclease family protein n=1 Tax=Gordonia amicalis TaxID=89053 RepID=A0ABU4DJQ8_9ACTN|nr:HNH endonuclease family protein [Gordonia amicalis]MDV6309996.1 HNH endonuclease family protein [Gordonia amicalis]
MMIVRRLVALLVGAIVVVALGVAAGAIRTESTDAAKQTITSWIDDTTGSHATPLTTQPVTGTPRGSVGAGDEVRQLLARVQVVSGLPDRPGYERSCRKGKACVFGSSWTDDSDAALSHNGCDTRNDILRSQLAAVQLDPKTHGCKVLSGVLDPDPYTGEVLQFRKGATSSDIEIDHVFPLEAAWHAGAHDWPLTKRVTFANDPANLLAADGSANSAKGSKTIADWLPPNRAYACTYIATYLRVAAEYQLPITTADQAVADRTC